MKPGSPAGSCGPASDWGNRTLCAWAASNVQAAHIARRLVEAQSRLALPPRTVLNVNLPNLPLEHIRGIQLTRLGHRARAAAPTKVVNPRGKEGYWIAVAGDAEDGGPGTDFHAVMQGFVSITPLQLDRTFNDAFEQLDGWLEGLL